MPMLSESKMAAADSISTQTSRVIIRISAMLKTRRKLVIKPSMTYKQLKDIIILCQAGGVEGICLPTSALIT